MSVSINFEVLTKGRVHNLSGHERGLAARELFKLDELDKCDSIVEIEVPDHIYGLSPSFIQGLLSASVKALGSSREAFFSHYHVKSTDLVKRQFDRGLSAILTDREFPIN
ncbi:hypothetical protein ACXYL9_05825 [Qipengyuania sp. CAU 1752]